MIPLMAMKYREEVVGKRFLALKTTSTDNTPPRLETDDLCSLSWLSGVIRASSDKETSDRELQVLVEFDDSDWQKRDWLKVHEDYSVFLVEETLVLTQRSHPEKPLKKCWWPALTFKSVVDNIGLSKSAAQPLEFLIDQKLVFLTPDRLTEYKEGTTVTRALDAECKQAAVQWCEYQDGQHILVSTPTVLVGFRVKVYRTEGTTQWFTAVIQQYNDDSKELSLLDDTVLEEHYESAELTQIIPLDGVVESILKGTEARIVPRRRACKETSKDQANSKDGTNTQSANASSVSNQVNTRATKQSVAATSNQSAASSSQQSTSLPAARGGSVRSAALSTSAASPLTGNKTTVTKKADKAEPTPSGKQRGESSGSTSSKQSTAATKKRSISGSQQESQETSLSTISVENNRAHTSVIRRAPKSDKRPKKQTSVEGSQSPESTSRPESKKEKQTVKKRASKKSLATSESTTVITGETKVIIEPISSAPTENVSQSPKRAAQETTENILDMHIKKQRILGAISDSTSVTTAPAPHPERRSEEGRSTENSVIVSGNAGNNGNHLPPPTSTPTAPLPGLEKLTNNHRIDKLSESSTDGCSSGYSSAATNDSTISPRDKDGQRIPGHPSMNSISRSSIPTPTSTLSSTPTPVVSANPAARLQGVPSPLSAKQKSNHQELSRNSNASSPLVVDTSKESPLVPYRDPELLKRDAEVRKMANTPSGTAPPSIPTSRSLSAAASLSAMPQGPALSGAAAMLNPQIAAQHYSMQQFMQQFQLMEQYRQIQAMQSLNPLQQLTLLQHQQQLAAVAQQQQLAMDSLYRQPRPGGLPTASQPWMMMPPFGDKPLLSDLHREHELRALDQKERAERAEREKLEKERAEKDRMERDKERRQLMERQERARVLKESAQLAQDAVNQHFTESLRRMPHTTTTPPNNPPAAAMWNNKKFMGAGDGIQPQDLSISNKHKDLHRQDMDNSRQRQEREAIQQYQAHLQMSQHLNLTEDKQKAINKQHEAFMRSIQTGSSGQTASSEAKLVDEHFLKAAGLAQMTPKSEQAEYSLYGYQSHSFPHRYVSKDQLQQQLIKDEKSDIKSPKSLSGRDMNREMSRVGNSTHSQQTPPRTTQPSQTNYSNQLIQEGLIPNPAYTPHGTSNAPTSNTSTSISALMNMSRQAGSHIADRSSKDKSQAAVKSEPQAQYPRSMPQPMAASSSGEPDGQPPGGLIKSFKSFIENTVTQAFYKDIEEQKKKTPPGSPPTGAPSVKSDKVMTNGVNDTDSDTLSAPSPTLSIKTESQDSKPCHPKMKLKKEWLQRHAEGAVPSSASPTSLSGSMLNNSNTSNHSETTTSASETETEHQGVHKHKSKKRKSDASSNGQQKKAKNSEVSSGHQLKNLSRLSGSSHQSHSSSGVRPAAGGDDHLQCSYNGEQDSIKQLAEIALRADRMEAIPYANKPLVRVNITTLKKTLQPFVQDGSCIEMAPKLTKCRECKMTPNQRNKKIPNIFCRFYAFRMLKFSRNGQINIAGFCDPSEAEPDDITIWLPHINLKSRHITPQDLKTAKYIIGNVGEEFCRLVEQEQECVGWSGNKRAWKRAVQGVREMCDVCDTTLFNTHWVCHRCGFVVCIDCYRVKRKIHTRTSNNVCEENRRWLSCTTNKNHEAEKLMLTSIIPADALKIARDLMHHVRRKHSIKANCICAPDRPNDTATANGHPQNVTSTAVSSSSASLVNGESSSDCSQLSQSYPQDVYRQSTYLSASLDNKTLNTYSDDPLSLLADVASMAPSTNPAPSSQVGLLSEVKLNGTTTIEEMDTETGEKKPCLTLRKLLTKSQANGAIMPSDKKLDGTETNNPSSTSSHSPNGQSRGSVIHSNRKQHEFAHYQRRSGAYLSGRTEDVPTCYLKETSLLYPDVKHSWLCDGKLLRLLDPKHPSNFVLFNQRWTLGQPIIVSNVSKNMKVEELWTPEAFSREFGHVRHDLIDCRRNEPLSGYEIKCFWDGFEDQSKRLTDADGEPLILKLKDWPSGEDFAESMPSRFRDLMSALPMPQYTARNGALNLAGRLPEFFVKPDLGPKMYNAYGLARYPQSGTTNLHLDVSDAVNVMVFVAHEKDLEPDVMKLIENSDCDDLMKRRIVEDGEVPGALWHIYDACDADKMRDLLNKVALELGMDLEPYHDPIHDQQFYLDKNLRKRLADEYGVHGYPILQCVGDAVFIPAGAPHQVQNLNGCIKVAEDFVSPEHLHHCFNLTQEFRHLSNTHTNHEDKLQVKNIIYHAIKDAVAILDQSDPIS